MIAQAYLPIEAERAQLERLIEDHLDTPEVDAFIHLLDAMDDDPDLEPSHGIVFGLGDECEPGEDDEPSLGSLEGTIDQSRWCDADVYVDPRDLDRELEPTLGENCGGRWTPSDVPERCPPGPIRTIGAPTASDNFTAGGTWCATARKLRPADPPRTAGFLLGTCHSVVP